MADRGPAPSALVLPGLAAADGSTVAMRAALARRGIRAHRWNLGRNTGPSARLMTALRSRLSGLVERSEEPIALVGWSMGGHYAHLLAEMAPEHVRAVVTLGSPLTRGDRRPRLEVPTASIYSRIDGVVPWQFSTVDDGWARHENIEVRTPHFLLGFDPAVIHAVGDRIVCEPQRWEPFRPPRFMRSAFPGRSAQRSVLDADRPPPTPINTSEGD